MIDLEIHNFRSIKKQSVELAPITVLYGPNGSGKSSLLYSLLILKNVIGDLDQKTGEYFDLGFANLGGFSSVVHNHRNQENILLGIAFVEEGYPVSWRVVFKEKQTNTYLHVQDQKNATSFVPHLQFMPPFEYTIRRVPTFEGAVLDCKWNGIHAEVSPVQTFTPNTRSAARKFEKIANAPVEFMRNTEFVPLQMGFSRGEYSTANIGHSPVRSEEELITLLADERYLQTPVSRYLERITGRTLRLVHNRKEEKYSVNVEDIRTYLGTELVNDGFGINRVTWLLTLALLDKTVFTCIEEPETHLHPSAIRKLARVFVDIVHKNEKGFLLTTHSEALVLALLAEVSRGNIRPDEIAFYLTMKEDVETKFERQEVNELGQVEGGLSSFMEGEMEDIAAFFEQKS